MISNRKTGRWNLSHAVVGLFLLALSGSVVAQALPAEKGSVIFIHPDGSGASMWNALRMFHYGPDSLSNWDRLDKMAMYRPHVLNSTNSSSHGGATIHSYGTKVMFNTYGNVPEKPVKSLSGKNKSIMHEAIEAGLATALVNSGHICEPGTGVFVASDKKRSNTDAISEQVIRSGVDVLFSGGEILLLPEGEVGRHGQPGRRKDGKNLIDLAKELGYQVVYTRDEMLALPNSVDKVLGVFAPYQTFNDKSEEHNKTHGLPLYWRYAPTVGEMIEKALQILENKNQRFLLVLEEEGTDNFGNYNNAEGTLEALRRADEAIGVAMGFVEDNPKTLIVTAADSDAGGFQMLAVRDSSKFDEPMPLIAWNGAACDGIHGSGTLPFVCAPDKNGVQLRFGVAWSCYADVAGAIIARAHGLNSHLMENNFDNTDVYRMMYATLFGRLLPPYVRLN